MQRDACGAKSALTSDRTWADRRRRSCKSEPPTKHGVKASAAGIDRQHASRF